MLAEIVKTGITPIAEYPEYREAAALLAKLVSRQQAAEKRVQTLTDELREVRTVARQAEALIENPDGVIDDRGLPAQLEAARQEARVIYAAVGRQKDELERVATRLSREAMEKYGAEVHRLRDESITAAQALIAALKSEEAFRQRLRDAGLVVSQTSYPIPRAASVPNLGPLQI